MSSGTRLIADIVGLDFGFFDKVRHSSLPSGPIGMPPTYGDGSPLQWWEWRQWGRGARFVVIVRRPDYVVRSIMARTDIPAVPKDELHIAAMYERALSILSDIPGAFWMSYEALVDDPEGRLGELAAWLGVTMTGHREVVDGNAKYRYLDPITR